MVEEYKSKPHKIKAIKVCIENYREIIECLRFKRYFETELEGDGIRIKAIMGARERIIKDATYIRRVEEDIEIEAHNGDYIIEDEFGNFEVLNEEIFNKRYEVIK